MQKTYNRKMSSFQHIKRVLKSAGGPDRELDIGHLFLVGGFAESAIVQEAVRSEFGQKMKVIIPQGASVAVLRGAVLYGLDPAIVHVRRAMKTYGLGVIKPFVHGYHPTGLMKILLFYYIDKVFRFSANNLDILSKQLNDCLSKAYTRTVLLLDM